MNTIIKDEADTQTYHVRLAVTVRAFAEETFEATDDEAAARYVEAIDPSDFNYVYDGENGIEGDAIAFWGVEDEDPEVEVVLKQDGEPLSWTACEITKDLAAMDHIDALDANKIAAIVQRAKIACACAKEG